MTDADTRCPKCGDEMQESIDEEMGTGEWQCGECGYSEKIRWCPKCGGVTYFDLGNETELPCYRCDKCGHEEKVRA